MLPAMRPTVGRVHMEYLRRRFDTLPDTAEARLEVEDDHASSARQSLSRRYDERVTPRYLDDQMKGASPEQKKRADTLKKRRAARVAQGLPPDNEEVDDPTAAARKRRNVNVTSQTESQTVVSGGDARSTERRALFRNHKLASLAKTVSDNPLLQPPNTQGLSFTESRYAKTLLKPVGGVVMDESALPGSARGSPTTSPARRQPAPPGPRNAGANPRAGKLTTQAPLKANTVAAVGAKDGVVDAAPAAALQVQQHTALGGSDSVGGQVVSVPVGSATSSPSKINARKRAEAGASQQAHPVASTAAPHAGTPAAKDPPQVVTDLTTAKVGTPSTTTRERSPPRDAEATSPKKASAAKATKPAAPTAPAAAASTVEVPATKAPAADSQPASPTA